MRTDTDRRRILETLRRRGILQELHQRDPRLQRRNNCGIIQENRANPYHDPETGRFTSGGGGKKGKKTKYAPSPQRSKNGVQLGAKRYARLCGILGTTFPGLKAGEIRKIRDSSAEYRVKADGYGGFETLSVTKLK